jgi:hypothetical protein
MLTVLPAPSQTFCWQLPAVWFGVGVFFVV